MKKGIMIQTFGKQFAALINMVTEPFVAVHSDYADQPRRVTNVSPFTICGKFDLSLIHHANLKPNTPHDTADIRKNFDEILKKSHCDYFVIDNYSARCALFSLNDEIYTFRPSDPSYFLNDFYRKDIKNFNETIIKPYEEGFSERFKAKYDQFIDIILANYAPEKIILIPFRTQKFGIYEDKIVKLDRAVKTDNLINELDRYFYSRVKCHVIDTDHIYTLPNELHIAGSFSDESVYGVERDILSVFGTAPKPRNLENSFSITTPEGVFHNLSDYIIAGGSDVAVIKEFIEKSFLTYDDIVSVLYLSEKIGDEVSLKELAELILNSKNSSPYQNTRRLFDKNIEFLRDYPYNNISLPTEFEYKIVIKISLSVYLMIDKNGFTRFNHKDSSCNFFWRKFYNEHFHCTLDEIEPALSSWETYFERGRNACYEPFVLDYKDDQEFTDSLCYLNYQDLLKNENIYLKLKEEALIDNESYTPNIKLDFFFDKRNRFAYQTGGIAERMFEYAYMTVRVFKKDMEYMYINDLESSKKPALLQNVAKMDYSLSEKYHKNILSNNLNSKLMLSFYRAIEKSEIVDYTKIPAIAFYRLGLREVVAVVNSDKTRVKPDNKEIINFECPQFLYRYSDIDLVEKRMTNDIDGLVYLFNGYNRTYRNNYYEQKQDFERIFVFPPFDEDDIVNTDISKKMLDCDAVVVHIRRGDFFTTSTTIRAWKKDEYYKEQLERAWRIPGYNNKHLFVFSDDFDFCRSKLKELGLDIAGDKLTYVEGNNHFDSFRDMQLMSLGMIIISSNSGFNQVATLMSKRVEYVLSVGTGYYDIFPKGQTLWHRDHPDEITGFEAAEDETENTRAEQINNTVLTDHKPNNKNTSKKKHKKRK